MTIFWSRLSLAKICLKPSDILKKLLLIVTPLSNSLGLISLTTAAAAPEGPLKEFRTDCIALYVRNDVLKVVDPVLKVYNYFSGEL
jgi:hypothetical protein